MEPPRNIQTWHINYIVVPLSNPILHGMVISLSPGLMTPNASTTFTRNIDTINMTGGFKISAMLAGLRATLVDSTKRLAMEAAPTIVSSTVLSFFFKNSAGRSINYLSCSFVIFYYNINQNSAFSAYLLPFIGYTLFGNSNDGPYYQTFIGLINFTTTNHNYLDFNMTVTNTSIIPRTFNLGNFMSYRLLVRIPVSRTACPVICGDGYIDPLEECDDGNVINGDGCFSNCIV
jgi:cysteine-rich repeat protein